MIPTFSPQGDGNDFTIYRLVYVDTGVDPYLFPARGRKPPNVVVLRPYTYAVDPYLFPARGRKQYRIPRVYHHYFRRLIPTFSPQGDGNVLNHDTGLPNAVVS